MTEKNAVMKSLLNWCEAQDWDLLLRIPFQAGTTVGYAEEDFRHWVYEIEQAYALPSFRWARFMAKVTSYTLEIYVLMAGLRKESLLPALKQWNEISGNTDAVIEYRRSETSKSVNKILQRLLTDTDFTIEVGVGPKMIGRRRPIEEEQDNTDEEAVASGKTKGKRRTITEEIRKYRRLVRRHGPMPILDPEH